MEIMEEADLVAADRFYEKIILKLNMTFRKPSLSPANLNIDHLPLTIYHLPLTIYHLSVTFQSGYGGGVIKSAAKYFLLRNGRAGRI